MAPEERRAALIEATIPLLTEHGLDVSTRQIAEAAGVAEGTIFGVFENKNMLVVQSVLQALDPQPTITFLDAIDRALPLRARLELAAERLHDRFSEHFHLLATFRKMLPHVNPGSPDVRENLADSRRRMHDSLAAVIEPDADQLRRSPHATARLLLLFCGGHTFGPFGEPDGFDAKDAVSLLLDGLLKRDDDTNTDLPVRRADRSPHDEKADGLRPWHENVLIIRNCQPNDDDREAQS